MAIRNDWILAAEEAIENEDQICFDVAAEYGQIFANVKHMSWFIKVVAEQIMEDTPK